MIIIQFNLLNLIILKKYLIFKMKIKLRNLKLLKIIYKDIDKYKLLNQI